MLLVESGNRINTTEFEWPKNLMPSGFSMKVNRNFLKKSMMFINPIATQDLVDGHVSLKSFEYSDTVVSSFHNHCSVKFVTKLPLSFSVPQAHPISKACEHQSVGD